VEQITFSGIYARDHKKQVLFITERAVFKLVPEGLMLIEIATGVDLQNDILNKMEFKPLIAPDLKQMDARIFAEKAMGIKESK
jgi:propionate CoA-transferase